MAEGASIKVEDKELKKDVRKASGSRKTSPTQKRMKFIWKVIDANSKEVASFPYQAQSEAEARASELFEKTCKLYIVNRVLVPMENDE